MITTIAESEGPALIETDEMRQISKMGWFKASSETSYLGHPIGNPRAGCMVSTTRPSETQANVRSTIPDNPEMGLCRISSPAELNHALILMI